MKARIQRPSLHQTPRVSLGCDRVQPGRTSDPVFQSYHSHLATYLCQEVFTDMSVLPLVFPDNMSCFSRGSYKVTRSPSLHT